MRLILIYPDMLTQILIPQLFPLYNQKTGIWCVISANQYFIKELLMLNDTLMHLHKKDLVILCKTAQLHTQLRKLSEHHWCVWGI
jgi:hypothetical protein